MLSPGGPDGVGEENAPLDDVVGADDVDMDVDVDVDAVVGAADGLAVGVTVCLAKSTMVWARI